MGNNVLRFFDEQMPYYKTKIENEIDRNRKGTAKIKIINSKGEVLENAEVRAVQKNHEFKFGCNIFMLDEFDDEDKNNQYKEVFKNLFNLAVVPFYWRGLEPVQGIVRFAEDSPKVYRRPAPDLVLKWCEANGIEPKGHPLLWHLYTPDWLPDNREEMEKLIIKRFKEISQKYKDRISSFDVCNESLTYHRRTALVNMPEHHLELAFRLARRHFPNNKLFINEVTYYSWQALADEHSPYFMQIENLINKGYYPDAIGMQYHLFSLKKDLVKDADTLLNPENLFEAMNLFGKFSVPLSVSEVTVPSYIKEERDEETQARITENLYKIWFSHESVESIVWWNLVDNTGAINPNNPSWDENIFGGGLLRKDFTFKQAGEIIDDLINKEWKTDVELNGKDYFEGFYGEYDLIIKCGSEHITKKIKLSKHSRNNFVIQI